MVFVSNAFQVLQYLIALPVPTLRQVFPGLEAGGFVLEPSRGAKSCPGATQDALGDAKSCQELPRRCQDVPGAGQEMPRERF